MPPVHASAPATHNSAFKAASGDVVTRHIPVEMDPIRPHSRPTVTHREGGETEETNGVAPVDHRHGDREGGQ